MPKRMLRDWTDSESINTLSPQAERLFVRLIMKADDYGRFSANPTLIRASLFPLLIDKIREADISRWLAECETAGVIALYVSGVKPLLEIRNFGQRLKESRPKFPAPNGDNPDVPFGDNFREVPGSSGKFPLESETDTETDAESETSTPPNSPKPGELAPAPQVMKRKIFVPPTPQEATDYAASIGFNLDGEKFVAHYQSRGWKFGTGKPVVDWKACVVTWKKRDESGGFPYARRENNRVVGSAGYSPGKYSHLG